jgi:capsule polysaccharide export protein KpsE/RkpR
VTQITTQEERQVLTPSEPLPVERQNFAAGGSLSTPLGKLKSLWSRRQYLLNAFFVGLAGGLLAAFSITPTYESTAQLMPPDQQSGGGIAMLALAKTGGMGSVASDLLGIRGPGALFAGILGSATVKDRIVERFNLRKAYGVRLQEDARKALARNTSISEDRKSGIISITVMDRDPKRAAAITQAYVEELNQLVAELSTSAAHRERVFLEERLTAVKRDLDQASAEFSQFASSNKTIDIKDEARALVEGASAVQGQLMASESELMGLKEIYAPGNVRVRSIEARIAELRRQLQKIGGGGNTESLRAGKSSDSFYPSFHRLPLLGVAYADLYRHTRIQESVYETLTEQYELAKVQEVKETPSVKVLDAANIPGRKSYPPRMLIMLSCAFLVLASAMVKVLASFRWTEIDANSPGKLFAQEVCQTLNAGMPWSTPNGSRIQALTHKLWVRLARSENAEKHHESSAS